MSWITGLLTGFQEQKAAREAENLQQAALASQREQSVFQALLGADNPEVQALAVAGLLESAQPKKRKGGIRGWLGEMEQSPVYGQLQQFLNTKQPTTVTEERETLPSRHLTDARATAAPGVQPTVTDPPPGQAPAAQAATSPVQGGPPRPLSYSQAPPVPYTMQSTQMQRPRIFMTPTERLHSEARARGETEGIERQAIYQSVYQAERNLGSPHEDAVLAARMAADGSSRRALASRTVGQVLGTQLPAGTVDVFGRPVVGTERYYIREEPGGGRTYTPAAATTASASMGTDREAIARTTFGRPFVQLSQAEQATVMRLEGERAQALAFSRGVGAGNARVQTELNMPIGTTAAIQYGVPPTTTLAQLSQTIGLSDEQKSRIYAIGQIDVLIENIDALLPEVFPQVQEGLRGQVKTQLSLGLQKLSGDQDLAALDASISAALAQVAQLSGQPGSRLSDRDIEIARATLVSLTPQVFGGDTINTARARVQVIKDLLEKARGGTPQTRPASGTPTTTPPPRPGATAAPAASPTPASGPANAVVRDGILYINGQAVGSAN